MYINMTPDKTNKTLHASQDDTTRQFKFKLFNDSQVLDTSDSIPPVIYDVEPNGIEQLLPVNSSTPTTSPIIADIQYPDELRENQEFFERITPTTLKGQAKVKKIKGNTIVWNQLIQNGNFADTSVWGINENGTLSVTNNEGAVTLSNVPSNTYSPNIRQATASGFVLNHKYLFSFDVYLPHKSYMRVEFGGGGFGQNTDTQLSANTWHRVSMVRTRETAPTSNFLVLYPPYATGVWSANDVWKIRNVNVFDLTLMFGAGNEPTSVSDFTDLFPLSYYDYNAGSLLNFNGTGIKSVGFNQWDEEWESGIYNTITGAKQSGTRVRSKNFIKVLPNTPYYMTIACNRYYYDGNFNYIGHKSVFTENTADTTPPNCAYMTFNTYDAYGQTYKNDIAVSLENGAYEPYTENTIDLPTSTYFPTGMKSAGTVYDELTPSKATTRIGMVDLGSLSWTYDSASTGTRFYAELVGAKKPTSSSQTSNMICAKYQTISLDEFYNVNVRDDVCALSTGGFLSIRDTTYNDAAAFKTAMNGVYLFYELNTPTEQDFKTCSLVSEDIEKPLVYDDGFLVCDSNGLTTKAGFIPCKIKMVKGDETLYSQLIQLHVERKP